MIDLNALTAPARRMQSLMTWGLALLYAVMAGLVLAVVTAPARLGHSLATVSGFPDAPIGDWQSTLLLLIVALHLAVWLVLFGIARKVFQHLAEADPDSAAQSAQSLSYWLWAMLAWGLASQMFVSVVATWGMPEGQRALHLAFGTSEIFVAFSALIAGFMARAFALGAELWRDHREVI
ncbi:MAG: hypothetical protein AAF646_13670 [Pseudomonadota bacterium]